jgi:predicted transcriptional regulator
MQEGFFMTIGTLASTRIIAVTPDTYAIDAAAIMGNLRISCLLVVHKGVPLGIITERDLVLSASRIIGVADLEVRDIMSAPVLTAAMSTPFKVACRLLLENEIRHLVLLDAANNIEGVVTPTDLLRVPGFERCLGDRTVEEIMCREIIAINGQQTARYALARMAEDQLGAVVIVDQQRPVGIFTDRDVARLMTQSVKVWDDPLAQSQRPVVTISPQMTLREASAIMRQNRIRKLVVVDGEGYLLGLLGQASLMALLDRFCGGKTETDERSPDCGFVEVSSACRP